MATLYSCLEEGGVGIFESPTGTGKSLSLLCATLRWLQDQDAKDERDQQPAPHADSASASSAVAAVASEPAWVEEQTAERKAVAQRAGRLSIAEARKQRSLRLSSVASAAVTTWAANQGGGIITDEMAGPPSMSDLHGSPSTPFGEKNARRRLSDNKQLSTRELHRRATRCGSRWASRPPPRGALAPAVAVLTELRCRLVL